VRKYLEKRVCPLRTWVDPSSSAAFGITRKKGGHSLGYRLLIFYELSCRLEEGLTPIPAAQSNWVKASRTLFRTSELEAKVGTYTAQAFASYFETTSSMLQAVNGLMLDGVARVLDRLVIVPVAPIVAPEKGLKHRLPTMTFTAVNIVQQVLRHALDNILRRDSRISESIGGKKSPVIRGQGLWYSQDLTTATDLHPFWLTRTVYEELVRLYPSELGWTLKYFDLIFGPKRLVSGSSLFEEAPVPLIRKFRMKPWIKLKEDGSPIGLYRDFSRDELGDIEEFPLQLQDALAALWFCGEPIREKGSNGLPLSRQAQEDFYAMKDKYGVPAISSFMEVVCALKEFKPLYEEYQFSDKSGVNTTVGAMMGDPTSWSVMPLMTIYSAEKCRVGQKLITCGDDALILMPNHDTIKKYNSIMESLGGTLSLAKSFIHKHKGLFTEFPVYDGIRKPRYLLSHWVSPPGGSKGYVHWANLPRAVLGRWVAHRRRARTDHLWSYSKWYYTWVAGKQLGLPLGAAEQLGGLNHPMFSPTPVTRRGPWLDKINSFTRRDLCVRRGLSLVPPPASRVCKQREDYLWRFTEGMFAEDGDIDGETLWNVIVNYEGQLDIFEGKDYSLKKVPSVITAAERFKRRVGNSWSGVPGSYARTVQELERKRSLRASLSRGYAGNPAANGLFRYFGVSYDPPLLRPRDWETLEKRWKPFSRSKFLTLNE
jgi:hypothetical protein